MIFMEYIQLSRCIWAYSLKISNKVWKTSIDCGKEKKMAFRESGLHREEEINDETDQQLLPFD